jgi:tetratricopeptide (TPR) repeat protein
MKPASSSLTSLLLSLAVSLVAAALTGCAASGSFGLGGQPSSSGGDEADGMAKKMPSRSTDRQATSQGAQGRLVAEARPDFRPKLDLEVASPAGEETQAAEAGEWGASDAERGEPLPKRHALNQEAREAFDTGVDAVARGDREAAQRAFEAALRADDRAYSALFNLGVLADRSGKTDEALEYYARALQMQPDYEAAAEAVAHIHLRRGAPREAVDFVRPLAERFQRNLDLQAILAHALIAAGELDQAEAAARAALRRDERFAPAMAALAAASLRRGRLELTDSILEQAAAIAPRNAEVAFLQGKRHQQDGRVSQAIASYRRAVKLRPDYAEARMALGIQYMSAGNYEEALVEFVALAELVPELAAVHLNLGDAFRATRRFREAKRALDRALRLQDRLPEAHYNLGLLYMDAGADFPGMDLQQALEQAVNEFSTYREQMGPRLSKDDPSAAYISDLQRQIERENKRAERDRARRQRAAEAGQ